MTVKPLDIAFFPDKEILIGRSPWETLKWLRAPDDRRRDLGRNARQRILGAYTPDHRAKTLEEKLFALLSRKPSAATADPPAEAKRHAG